MTHVALLGDSIFDNKSYVGANGKDVVTHLRDVLPDDWQATLCAIDGSVIENVSTQLRDVPNDATHFVISVGGNDAIRNADVLQMRVDSSAEFLGEIANRTEAFEFQYKKMLSQVLEKNLPTAVCTIYYPNFAEAQIQRIAVTALASFNDVIIRQAVLNGLPILDLRLVCNEATDYANAIEPSDKGGRKISAKIFELSKTHDFSANRTQIFF